MNRKTLTELIYRWIDGDLNESERSNLEKYLSGNPDADNLAKQIRSMQGGFKNLKSQPSPGDLTQEIMRKIRKNQAVQPDSSASFLSALWLQPLFRYSAMFVGGILAGFMVFGILKGDFSLNKGETEGMRGTFYNSSAFDELKPADVLIYEENQVKVVCNARYSESIVVVQLELLSEQALRSIIEFNPAHFRLINVQNTVSDPSTRILSTVQSIQIESQHSNTCQLWFENKTKMRNPLSFKVLNNDNLLYQNTILIN